MMWVAQNNVNTMIPSLTSSLPDRISWIDLRSNRSLLWTFPSYAPVTTNRLLRAKLIQFLFYMRNTQCYHVVIIATIARCHQYYSLSYGSISISLGILIIITNYSQFFGENVEHFHSGTIFVYRGKVSFVSKQAVQYQYFKHVTFMNMSSKNVFLPRITIIFP